MSTEGTKFPSEEPGVNLARALRRMYPRDTAKQVARDLDVTPRAVTSWLAFDERLPQATILLRMFDKYGPEFAAEIAPDSEWSRLLRQRAEIETLKRRLARAQEALADA